MELGTVYVEVAAEHLEPLKEFYLGRLGLGLRSEEPGESVWFQAGATAVGFHATTDPPLADPGRVNLSFDVDDTVAHARRLQEAGVEIAQGPMTAPWNGAVVAVLFDPVGHTVWLSGPPPT